MKPTILFSILFSALFFSGKAQNDSVILKPFKIIKSTFKGRITNAKTGEPLVGASVFFPDLKTGGPTNSEGFFELHNIPSGSYLFEVSHVGFASVLETEIVNGNTQKDFALSPSVVETEAVTVTGVSAATSVKRSPFSVSIVKKEDLLREASTNLIDALSKQPGVSNISTGPAVSKPVIRGLGYNRIVVVNDGIRQEGQQWGDEHGIEIDELNVSKAEILKGPASLMYGSDAIAGVINIISIAPTPQNTIKGNVLATYQTNNMLRAFHGDVGGNYDGFIWGLYGSHKAAADYKNKYDGYVFNSKFNERNFGGHIGLNKAWGYSHLLFSSFYQRLGLVEGERDSATGLFIKPVNDNGVAGEVVATNADFKTTSPFIPRQQIQHLKVATDNSFSLGANRLTVTVGYQQNQRQEFGDVLAPAESQLHFDLKTLNYNLQFHFNEKRDWKTTVGINGMKQSHANRGSEFLIPAYSLLDIGGFVYSQKKFSKLTLSGGGRIDNRSIDSKQLINLGELKFPSFKKSFTNFTASAGVAYQAGKDVTLKFNVARGFRAPSIPELASNGAHEGTNRFEYGEQNLKSETSLQADGGFEMATEHVSMSVSVFYNAVNNFIYYRKLASTFGGDSILDNDGQQFFAFRFSQNNAKLYGVEANLDIHPHPLDWLHLENTFSYVRAELNESQDGSNNLPFIPAPRLINEVKVEFFKKAKTIHNLYAKLELDNSFKQSKPFTGYNTETETPAYSLLNVGFGGEVSNKRKTLFSLFFSANNLTDIAYQNHLSRLKYAAINNLSGRHGVFNTGRNFSLKVNVPLSFNLK